MRLKLIVIAFLLLAPIGTSQTPTRSDNWGPLRSLVGIWEGTGNGQPGVSKVQREYRFVLNDKFMSSKHAEIKAENGMWILRDSGSTNGTYVNNRRVDRHELVDNDFIKFGSAMCKFKAL